MKITALPLAVDARSVLTEAKVRLTHASPSTPDVDIYLLPEMGDINTSDPAFTNVPFGADTGVLSIGAGTYDIYVTAAGSKTPAISATGVALSGGEVWDVIARDPAPMSAEVGPQPLITRELPPPGYWHFGREMQDLDAAQLVLRDMVGTFEKPRYFTYDAGICAHARSGRNGCRRCIDSCPAEAIISIGEQVEVNPNLCQGGGICATVCPTGAMRYAYPTARDTAERIRLMLLSYREAGGSDPVVLFVSDADAAGLPPTQPNVLLVVVEELASVGHEIWFATLAWGAGCVLLADGGSVPSRARVALDKQLAFSHDLLRGMGYPTDALCSMDLNPSAVERFPATPLAPPADFAALDQKRQLASMALDHLWAHAPQQKEWFAVQPGAPYGRIRIQTQQCTLCMACTSVCPARALSAGDDAPRLVLHEANCVQCSICANSCPERAITLEARYLADPERRRQAVVLHEEPPFCCVACGKPFAPKRAIDNILEKLAGHAMFETERARRRLQMCEDCRVVDAVQDADAMQSGLFGNPAHHNNDS